MEDDIEFLKQIAQTNEGYPITNPWRETIPLQTVLGILEKYK